MTIHTYPFYFCGHYRKTRDATGERGWSDWYAAAAEGLWL